ncbi:MAG: flagellar export chaperone FliS [Oscillospiraceae bacterium]|nr:flagellar export chaperone FliS [Oscillospiraceae bacterium]
MAALNQMRQYQEQAMSTATPGMITVMVFDEVIKNINLANKAIDEGNIQDSHDAIMKAENIYLTLMNFLDERFEVSKSLTRLYEYMAARLVEANMKKSKAILKEVMDFTVEFRDTWKQAEKHARIEQSGGKVTYNG